jgi:hypothetical protein
MDAGWVVGLVVALILISGVVWILFLMRLRRPQPAPTFEGDPVYGTAQVVSVQGVHGRSREDYDQEQIRMALCEMVLRVQLPGQEPYDVTIFPHVRVDVMAGLQGKTFVMEADSANPQNVRIDFTQPIRPAA